MPKRILQGKVISDKNDKTVVVVVERAIKHALYGKTMKRSKKFHAHDADNSYGIGDVVRIRECMPVSRHKRWEVIDAVHKASSLEREEVAKAVEQAEA